MRTAAMFLGMFLFLFGLIFFYAYFWEGSGTRDAKLKSGPIVFSGQALPR